MNKAKKCVTASFDKKKDNLKKSELHNLLVKEKLE